MKKTYIFILSLLGLLVTNSVIADSLLTIKGNPLNLGYPSIPYGTNTIALTNNPVHMQIDQYSTNSGTIYECVGYSGATNGSERDFWIDVTNNITVTWEWVKRYYYLDVGVNTNGTVDISDGWYANNVVLGITPEATKSLWAFSYWSGDVPAADTNDNPLIIIMNQPRTIVANFERTTPPIPVISNAVYTSTNFRFEWEGEVGRSYSVRYSTNMVNWITKFSMTCPSNITALTYIHTFTVTNISAFYKLSVY